MLIPVVTYHAHDLLQAMARCHRIGQQKEVTVYRLVTRDTYEEHLFQTASRKYGECWATWYASSDITVRQNAQL